MLIRRLARDVDAGGLESFHFLEQRGEIDHHAVADDGVDAEETKTLFLPCCSCRVCTNGRTQLGAGPPNPPNSQSLPASPSPQAGANQGTPAAGGQIAAPQTNPGTPLPLTLKQAEALAVKNNPQISAARLIALASRQVTREVRSAFWPTVTGNLTAADAESGSRITAGALNNPIIYERAAAGAMVTQLITDFGRTANLVSSANYMAKAENQNALATKEQILLAVDTAFYNALQAQAVLRVAEQTVNERQTVTNQVGALFKSKLKSELDYSFASVNLAQAQLLLLDAEGNKDATLATLSMVLGYPSEQNVQLIEDASPIAPPPGNVNDLIAAAFSTRPEILSLQFQYQSARKFQTAERDLAPPNDQCGWSGRRHARGEPSRGSESERARQHLCGRRCKRPDPPL